MEKLHNTWVNRDGTEVIFILEDETTISCTGYDTNGMHIVENNNSPLYKKDNPTRVIIPMTVDFIGGPYLFVGMDANDFLFNRKITDLTTEYLEQEFRRIVKKIDVLGPKTILTYEQKPNKKEPNTIKKNTSTEAEY